MSGIGHGELDKGNWEAWNWEAWNCWRLWGMGGMGHGALESVNRPFLCSVLSVGHWGCPIACPEPVVGVARPPGLRTQCPMPMPNRPFAMVEKINFVLSNVTFPVILFLLACESGLTLWPHFHFL